MISKAPGTQAETTSATNGQPRPPKLLDRVRLAVRARHPMEMGEAEIGQFLSALARDGKVSASTQNQALSALLFLYREVLGRDIAWVDGVVRARAPRRLPVVLTRDEVRAVLQQMRGTPKLMTLLLYGGGLRLLECCQLRVKDMDFASNQILVQGGKGDKDRVAVLPSSTKADLGRHLELVRNQHQEDLRRGAGWVELPGALARKYPTAAREWGWQWIFPATRIYTDHVTGQRRRHHLHETVVQRAVKEAVRRAGVTKPASCHYAPPLVRHPSPGGRL